LDTSIIFVSVRHFKFDFSTPYILSHIFVSYTCNWCNFDPFYYFNWCISSYFFV